MQSSNFANSIIQLVQAFTLLLPITFSGISLIVCMRKGWLSSLDVPLDGGLRFRGAPLIGKSKTLRSLVLYLFVATITTFALHVAATTSSIVAPVFLSEPIALAFSTTLAYLAGEIINSFIKRRLGVAVSGQAASKVAVRIQAVFDNVDGILASGLILACVYQVSALTLAISFILAITIHLTTDLLMRRLKLKN